jgi:glycosyltransferase involved in cell wall biosynthesis
MLRALAVCRDKNVDCQLLVAGAGPELPGLKKLAEELGITENVVWLGALAHDDIWTLMNVADVFMITNDVTNRCNPLYEAAWAGLPVVSVIDSSTADLLKDGSNALLADRDDTDGLGKRLAEICCNSALAGQFHKAQKDLAATLWTWEERMNIEVDEMEKLVNAAMPKRDKR